MYIQKGHTHTRATTWYTSQIGKEKGIFPAEVCEKMNNECKMNLDKQTIQLCIANEKVVTIETGRIVQFMIFVFKRVCTRFETYTKIIQQYGMTGNTGKNVSMKVKAVAGREDDHNLTFL